MSKRLFLSTLFKSLALLLLVSFYPIENARLIACFYHTANNVCLLIISSFAFFWEGGRRRNIIIVFLIIDG